jgi:hypothetical protein
LAVAPKVVEHAFADELACPPIAGDEISVNDVCGRKAQSLYPLGPGLDVPSPQFVQRIQRADKSPVLQDERSVVSTLKAKKVAAVAYFTNKYEQK